MKKLMSLTLVLIMLLALGGAALATEASTEAVPAKFDVTIDGEGIDALIYAAEGNSYLRVLDIAYALDVNFVWNSENFQAELYTDAPFEGDAPALPTEQVATTAVPAKFEVLVDGEIIEAKAYAIGGNTYLRMHDVAKALNISFVWNSEDFRAEIDTSAEYVAPVVEEEDPAEEDQDPVEDPEAETPHPLSANLPEYSGSDTERTLLEDMDPYEGYFATYISSQQDAAAYSALLTQEGFVETEVTLPEDLADLDATLFEGEEVCTMLVVADASSEGDEGRIVLMQVVAPDKDVILAFLSELNAS